MADQRRAGLITLKAGGEVLDAKGNFTWNLGLPKRTAVVGSDSVHGYKETPQVAFVEGEITDRGTLSLRDLIGQTDVTVTLDIANGKIISITDAWFAADGNGSTEEANFQVRWESKKQGQEIS